MGCGKHCAALGTGTKVAIPQVIEEDEDNVWPASARNGLAADLRQAKTETPRLGVGVHLNFTVGRPLLPPEWCASLFE